MMSSTNFTQSSLLSQFYFVPKNKSKIFRFLSKTQLNQTDFNEIMNTAQDELQPIILWKNNIDDAL